MFSISAADVFRTRQAVRDLKGLILSSSDATLERLAAGMADRRKTFAVGDFRRWLDTGGCRFSFPEDEPIYTAILLAAALPDDDYPGFTVATALLLCDALQDGDGSDDLYWNWLTFAPQYRMADAPVRATIMNGFRALNRSGRVTLGRGPSDADCMSRTRSEVLGMIGSDASLAALIEGDSSSEAAGKHWSTAQSLSQSALRAFRYLYERPGSIAPTAPENVALLPWRP